VLQLSGWRRLKEQFGWRGSTVAGAGGNDAGAGDLLGGSQLLLKRASGLTLAYAPRGPITDWGNRFATEMLLQAMRARALELGAVVLKIEPDLPDTPANRALLQSHGFTPSRQTVQPPSTIVLDLDRPEEAILAGMKSKWRYNVRLAERKGVTVRAMGAADLPAFHALMQVTGERDGFATHSADYFTAAFNLLVPQHAVYLLAEYAGEPLGVIVVAAVGRTACYLWGASSDQQRNLMPNHALQWAGIRWARQQGATRYDFWGIPDALGKLAMALRGGDGSGIPSDELPIDLEKLPPGELWGVYRFKQGFGGEIVRSVGAWDTALDTVGYRIYQLGLDAREAVGAVNAGLLSPAGARQAGLAVLSNWLPPQFTPWRALEPEASAPVQVVPIATAAGWRSELAQLPNPHVLQSWEWGAIKAQTGWCAQRYALADAAGAAAFQLLWRQPLGLVPLRIAYVPKGPLLDWSNLDAVDKTLEAIERQAAQLGCIYVKIDPDVRADTTVGRLVLHALQRRGWRRSDEQVQFQNTAYSDLSGTEETLLAQMKQKWRYNIRLAEKRSLRVRMGDERDFVAFYTLYSETGARDGFLIRPFDYYAQTWRAFLQAQAEPGNPAGGALLLAEHPEEAEPVAGLFLFRYGTRTWYFYGASSERHRRDMPNYLLQWEALRWAKAQGCTIYDWWGAPTEPDTADDAMQGVWQFKQGFGAQLQPHIGAWDYVVSPPLYALYRQAMPAVLDWMRSRGERVSG
jgi:lipid II:glycine glycyltransferase (peptidoglycan interpeptide bridge formation enzyme)